MKFNFASRIDLQPQSSWREARRGRFGQEEANVGKQKRKRRIECAALRGTSETVADGKRGENGTGRGRGLVSQTVRKRLTPRIKWYRNETIVEQMPGHKTTASSFPSLSPLYPPP